VGGSLRILLVGTRVLPVRHQGDKNFWLDVIHRLQAQGHQVDIVSVTADATVPASDLPIHHVRPIPVYLDRAGSRFNAEHDFLTGSSNYASKSVTLPRLLRAVRDRRLAFRPDVIHFMDNYGPAMLAVRGATGGVPATVSAPTYHRNRALYDLFLRLSLSGFDTVVPFSEAFSRRLGELGVPAERTRVIRWGVDTDRFVPPPEEERREAKRSLGFEEDAFVVLWTGFTQQSGLPELRFALETATEALGDVKTRVRFAFCFKAEHYRQEFAAYERPGLKVLGTPAGFASATTAADLLLSPLLDSRSTAAPPLVWVEAMARGIPLVTNAIPGAEEAAVPGTSGTLVRTPAEARKAIDELSGAGATHSNLRSGARRLAMERFGIGRAVSEHLALWKTAS